MTAQHVNLVVDTASLTAAVGAKIQGDNMKAVKASDQENRLARRAGVRPRSRAGAFGRDAYASLKRIGVAQAAHTPKAITLAEAANSKVGASVPTEQSVPVSSTGSVDPSSVAKTLPGYSQAISYVAPANGLQNKIDYTALPDSAIGRGLKAVGTEALAELVMGTVAGPFGSVLVGGAMALVAGGGALTPSNGSKDPGLRPDGPTVAAITSTSSNATVSARRDGRRGMKVDASKQSVDAPPVNMKLAALASPTRGPTTEPSPKRALRALTA